MEFSRAEQMGLGPDEDVKELSARLIRQKREAYEELAK